MSSVRLASRFTFSALTCLLAALPVFGDDWVMAFHDSRHTGQTSEVVTTPLTLAWTWRDTNAYDTKPQWYPGPHQWYPIFYQGKICIEGGLNPNRVFCLNPSNGSTVWEQDNPGYTQNGYMLYQFDNYPAALSGRIINATTDFTASMDAATGTDVKLSYNTNGAYPYGGVAAWKNLAYTQFVRTDDSTEAFYIAQDPVALTLTGNYYLQDGITRFTDYSMRVPAVDAGICYVNIMGQLTAYDARTGAVLWRWGSANFYSSPAVLNGIVYFYARSQAQLYALDTNHATYSATLGWQIPTLWKVPVYNSFAPIVSDGVVYAGSGYDGYFYALDALTGATKWRFYAGSAFTADQMPAISGNLIYVPTSNGILYALDKRTGLEQWRYTGTSGFGPVVIGSGMVFVSDRQFNFYAFRPATAAIGPAVTGFSTTRAANGQPATLTITGSGFFGGGSSSAVQSIRLDNAANTPLTGFTVASDSSITGAVVPAGVLPGVYHVRVQTSVGQTVNEPTFEVTAANSAFPATLGLSTGNAQGTGNQMQRHLARTGNGTLVAVYPGFADMSGGSQNPTYNISHDGGLTWTNQSQLIATPWTNFVALYAPASSIWVDSQDRLNAGYVRWSNPGGESFEQFTLNANDFLIQSAGLPVSMSGSTSYASGVTQASGRVWMVFESGGQIAPLYSDNGGLSWTQMPAINQATGNSPALVMNSDQPVIFFTESGSLAWSQWNGQQWSARQILPGIGGVQSYSAVATRDGQIHVAYQTGSGVSYIRYSSGSWSTPQTLDGSGNSPSLTTDGTNLWCFYANSSGDVAYRRTSSGQWNTAVNVTSDGNANTAPSTLPFSPDATIPVIWTSGTAKAFTVKSAVVAGAGAGTSAAPAATDVSSQVTVSQTALVYNRVSRLWSITMTLTNIGATTLSGPVQTVLTALSSNATLTNASGSSNGSPFITVSAAPLAPGASMKVQLSFTNSTNGAITFTPKTYSGGL